MTTDLLTAYQLSLVDKSPNTVLLYCSSVRVFLRSLPEPDVEHLTVEAIRAYLKDISARNAPNTVAARLKALRSFCQWATAEAGLDPSVLANMPSKWSAPRTVPVTATAEEIEALLAATEGKQLLRPRAALCLAAQAGLRSDEIRTLKWADVDLPNMKLNVTGKGGKLREVPIFTMKLYETLRELPKESPLVLPGQSGHTMQSHTLVRMIHEACERAGITRLPDNTDRVCHALRHGFAALSVAKGVPVPQLQYILGHSTINMTEKYLTALRGPEPAREAWAAAGVFA